MLCRTASDLYWAARNIERAENTARLLDVTLRIAMLPHRLDRAKASAGPWRRALEALDLAEDFLHRYGRIDAESVVRHLVLSADNPGSIYRCLRDARENARAQRVAITSEMYEDLNSSWLEMRSFDSARIHTQGLASTLEWVKHRSASFRGVTIGTLGRGEGYQFLQLGSFIERADWAIRLLDIASSDSELPDTGEARDAVQYFQWSALLQALSAFETYRRCYRESVKPGLVADLMLLQPDNPCSLQTCADTLHSVLRNLAGNDSLQAVRLAGQLSARARYARIDEVIAGGLERWLQETMAQLIGLGEEIHRQFMLATDTTPIVAPAMARARSQWQA